MLVTSLMGRDDSPDSSSSQKETGAIQHLIQKDRVLAAAADEVKYIKTWEADQTKQLQELSTRIAEISSADDNQKKDFEDEIRSSLNEIIASDENRRVCFQLAHDEEHQTVAVSWQLAWLLRLSMVPLMFVNCGSLTSSKITMKF